jgi:hypothetical protein
MFEVVKLIVGFVTLFYVVKSIKSSTNKYIAFVVFALWLRFFLSAFHYITFPSLIAGFSINAVGSIFVVFFGVVILPSFSFRLRQYIVFYVFFIAIIISGCVNSEYKGLINVLVKWGYFFVISAALFLALRLQSSKIVFKTLLIPFLLPVVLQIFSILLGEVKATEIDGSASYIGGYNHEAAFSMNIVGFILVLGWLEKNTIKFHSILFFGAVSLLILVNYRTSMLAILPVVLIFILTMLTERLELKHKMPVLFFVSIPLVFIVLVITSSFAERFSDISLVLNNLDGLVKAPVYFTQDEMRIFSSRLYLWSQYLSVFFDSDTLHQVFGFGPESWSGLFSHYAHNAYVSYIFEYGYFGITAFLSVNIYLLRQALNNQCKKLGQKLFFSVLGLMVMNLSTMPLWNIEGLICYALISGAVFAKGHQPVERYT